ncbi:MAG: hypothetical protein M5U08_11925 [Burkholderiales bacterium]|nr:hypothetical protein [Burkholderiales bacterium]
MPWPRSSSTSCTICAVVSPNRLRSPLLSVQCPPTFAASFTRAPSIGRMPRRRLSSTMIGSSLGVSITKMQR